jgi:heptosyltransferase-2/heptosyltransferase-3
MTLRFPGFDRGASKSSLFAPYGLLVYYAMLLRAGRFDSAFLLRDDHWWGAALALLAGIPHRHGYAVPACKPLLTTALPWNPRTHVTRQALELVQNATGGQATVYTEDCEQFPLVYTPPADDQTWVQTWLQTHTTSSTRGSGARRLVVLHPGTGGHTKLWPNARWAAVANRLVAQYGVQIVLTGGPGEEELVQQLASLLSIPPVVLAGTLSIEQLTALLGMATLVMGVDSGPLHLAVSQQTPTLHLYGASDAQRFGPWGVASRHVVVQAHLWCSPCGVFDACPRQTDPPECMDALTVEQVVQVASRLLEEWRMQHAACSMLHAGQPGSRPD